MSHHGSNPLIDKFYKENYSTDKVGPTGKFPDGKLNEDDNGELCFGVAVDKENKKVILNFNTPTAWIGFNPDQAIELANILIKKCRELNE